MCELIKAAVTGWPSGGHQAGGLEDVLRDSSRPPKLRRDNTNVETHIGPGLLKIPAGARRWVFAFLEQAALDLAGIGFVNREPIRCFLKQLPQAVVRSGMVCQAS